MVGQKKGIWEAKKRLFVVKILGSFSNWAWELSRSMEEYTPLYSSFDYVVQVCIPYCTSHNNIVQGTGGIFLNVWFNPKTGVFIKNPGF